MSGYIYLPVPTPEMMGFAQEWVLGQKKRKNAVQNIEESKNRIG